MTINKLNQKIYRPAGQYKKTMPRLLELFSGTKSVSDVYESNGWETVTVDILDEMKPDIVADVTTLDYKTLWKPGDFDHIHASPPCTTFSVLQHCSGKKTAEQILENIQTNGIPPLRAMEAIIDYLKPKTFTIENPAYGRMNRYINIDADENVLCYCMYGFDYKKPTRIWTNIKGFVPKMCNHKELHPRTIGGRKGRPSVSKMQSYRLPVALTQEIVDLIQKSYGNV